MKPETHDPQLAVAAIRSRWNGRAETAVILGTGLGELADEVQAEAIIAYRDLPGFPHSTALAHKGRLVCGMLGGSPVVMMQGRCHLYEGYPLASLAFPVRVLAALGCTKLIVTNAAGAVNPQYQMGDVMLIDDHINLMWLAGTCGLAADSPGRVARERVRLYDAELADEAARVARRGGFPLPRGVYVAVPGPCYETRAEYRFFRRIGGDCVGMSTVPEVLTAVGYGLRILGLSTVTNVALPDAPKTVSAEDVVRVAEMALPKVRSIVQSVVGSCFVQSEPIAVATMSGSKRSPV